MSLSNINDNTYATFSHNDIGAVKKVIDELGWTIQKKDIQYELDGKEVIVAPTDLILRAIFLTRHGGEKRFDHMVLIKGPEYYYLVSSEHYHPDVPRFTRKNADKLFTILHEKNINVTFSGYTFDYDKDKVQIDDTESLTNEMIEVTIDI
jgi:hypothetical protein